VVVPLPSDHQGIYFSGPEGAQGILGRSEPGAELLESLPRAARDLALLDHGER
jgi:hypothetical protein